MLPLECHQWTVGSFEPLVCTGAFGNELRSITAAFQGRPKCTQPQSRQMLHGRHWHCCPMQGEWAQWQSPAFCCYQGRGKAHHWIKLLLLLTSVAAYSQSGLLKFSGYGYLPSSSCCLRELSVSKLLSVFFSPETSSPVVKARILTCVEGVNVPLLEQAIQEQRKYFNERQEQREKSTSWQQLWDQPHAGPCTTIWNKYV